MADFFFFQAEDGIRDDLVTGVQTCALPISQIVYEISSEKSEYFSKFFRAENSLRLLSEKP